MKALHVLLCVFSLLINVNAADYYVNPVTGNNDNIGSAEFPWKSVSHGLSVIQPGDVLNLHAGSYQPISGIPAGAPGMPITIKSVDGERAVITNPGVSNGILITNDYIIIDGLEIGNVKNNGVNIKSNYVTIRNCIIHDMGLAVKTNTSYTNHHILIEYCSIYNFSDIAIFPDAVDKMIIRNNVMYNSASVMMDPGGVQELLIENNFVANPGRKLGALKIRWGNVEDVTGPNCNGAIVRNNIFLEGNKYNILLASANGAMVYNNVLINNMLGGSIERGIVYMQKDPADINEGKPLGPNMRNVLKNNIIQVNGGDSYTYDHNALVEVRTDMAEDISSNEFDNNLYYKSPGSLYIVSGNEFISENDVVGWNSQFDFNSIVGQDPNLNIKDTLESPRDYLPVQNSPVIDKGTRLTVTVNSGTSNILTVEDSRYFYSGHGMINGDEIAIGNSETAIVMDRDLVANTLTLDKVVSWEEGDSVSLMYSGSAPDIGAYELGIEKEIGNAAGSEELFKLINHNAGPTDIKESMGSNSEFHLPQNYPNPFSAKGGSASGGNPFTTIEYKIPSVAVTGVSLKKNKPNVNSGSLANQSSYKIMLKVYDMLGREVATLVDKEQTPGNYKVKFYASGLSSGVYYYSLIAGNYRKTNKMILLR